MDIKTLISIGVFTSLFLLTVLFWRDYLRSARSKEGFSPMNMNSTVLSDKVIELIAKNNEPVPTDQDAVEAHQTLLRYIRNDFPKGVKFIMDLRDRFFGPTVEIRRDLDIRTLLDNYQSPLQRL
jgi:hypothetical protein